MPGTFCMAAGEAGVATIVLSRAEKKNALSIALRDEVSDAIDVLAGDDSVKVIVITGAGNVFSAGFDLGEFRQLGDPDHARRLWDSSDRFHSTLLRCPLPTIAAVNGPAIAGGFDLAVCATRVASTTLFAHRGHVFAIVYGPATTRRRCGRASWADRTLPRRGGGAALHSFHRGARRFAVPRWMLIEQRRVPEPCSDKRRSSAGVSTHHPPLRERGLHRFAASRGGVSGARRSSVWSRLRRNRGLTP
jgi:hypothetical protein